MLSNFLEMRLKWIMLFNKKKKWFSEAKKKKHRIELHSQMKSMYMN